MAKAWLSAALLVGLVPMLGATVRAQQSYVVRPGDTLVALARRFDTTVTTLKTDNDLRGDMLRIGQVLRVPDAAQVGYRITIAQPGETLATIASRAGRSVASLLSANPGLGTDGVRAGAAISVPPADGVTVLARQGDTLAALAARAGISARVLGRLNGLDASAPLRPGQPVLLPGRSPSAGAGDVRAGQASVNAHGPAVASTVAASTPEPTASLMGDVSARDRLRSMQDVALRAAVARLPAVAFGTRTFLAPVHGVITSRFGWRALAVNGNHFHAGVDLAAPMGTPVHAARDGVVVRAGWGGSYGNVVFLDHGDGTQTRYAHLSHIDVRVGEAVRQGDVLGLVGSTGASTGPHVHFELRFEGRAVDPLDYLQGLAGR